MFLKNLKKISCPQKVEKTTLKSCSEKLKSTFFPLNASTAQMAQTEEFMFQNVAFRPTVYKTVWKGFNSILGQAVGFLSFVVLRTWEFSKMKALSKLDRKIQKDILEMTGKETQSSKKLLYFYSTISWFFYSVYWFSEI